MIYIRKNNNVLEKYYINYNIDELKELRKKIVKNCAEKYIIHKEMKENQFPNTDRYLFEDNEMWSNHGLNVRTVIFEDVKKRKSGNKGVEWDHYDEYEVDLYYFDYTKYICPYLVYFIDEFIRGNNKCIDVLYNKDTNALKKFLTVEEKIEQLNKELRDCQLSYIDEKKKKINDLNKKYRAFNRKKNINY